MDIESIVFFILFGLMLFIILYNSFRAAAWHKYRKIDERILDLKGEEVEARFVEAKQESKKSRYYNVVLSYTDSSGHEQKANLVSYQKATKPEVNYMKKQNLLSALAYKDIIEVDLSDMVDDGSEVIYMRSAILGALSTWLFPFFSRRFGFPPRNPRKKLLKEFERNE